MKRLSEDTLDSIREDVRREREQEANEGDRVCSRCGGSMVYGHLVPMCGDVLECCDNCYETLINMGG